MILVEYLIVFGIGFFHSLIVANKLPSGNLSARVNRCMFPLCGNIQRRSRALNRPPVFCRVPLRYTQQKTGGPHQAVSQKIASEFSDIQLNGAQLRRYVYKSKGKLKWQINN